MYALYILFLVLGIILAILAILQMLFAVGLYRAVDKLPPDLAQQGVDVGADVAIEAIQGYVIWLRVLFKILPFTKKLVKSAIKKELKKQLKNLVPKVKRTCLYIAIISVSTLMSAVAMFSRAMSFKRVYDMQMTAAAVVNDLIYGDDPTPEELEEEGWVWDEQSDGYTYTPSSSGTTGGSGTPYGQATGDYAIQLDDGTYYWYHQTSSPDSCTYCGDWTAAQWGGDNFHSFGTDGCAVYSLAIIVSNLMGYPVTPMDLFEDCFGCEVTDEGGVKKINTTNSSCFVGRGIVYNSAVTSISTTYGLEARTHTRGSTPDTAAEIEFIDSILDAGGLVWGYWVDANCVWCGNGSQHFMGIRKYEGDNYYCFTSCSGKCASTGGKEGAIQVMNYPLDKETCLAGLVPERDLYGLIPTVPPGTSSVPGGTINNTEIYNKLAADSRYSAKASILTAAYEKAEPLYGESFAIGLMANILSEGNIGKIEGMWTRDTQPVDKHGNPKSSWVKQTCNCDGNKDKWVRDYWMQVGCDVHALEYTTIDSISDIDTLLSIPDGVGGIGVGAVQWSGGRRVGLLNKYKQEVTAVTTESLQMAELNFMMDEFNSGYSDVVTACNGKAANECASVICKEYEKPEDKDVKAVERSNVAADLESYLKSN